MDVNPQRVAGPVRCWRPGWDTGSGRCGPDRESGHRGQQLAGKDGFMLDHLSIQCADVAASATFYDAVLAPLGGRRVMDFGEVIGFGVPPRPEFWIGPRTTGEGSARRISRSWHPTGLPCGHSSRQRSALMPKCSMNHASGPSTTQAITAPSCVTPTATTSKPFAAPPDSGRRRAWRHLPLPTTVRHESAPQGRREASSPHLDGTERRGRRAGAGSAPTAPSGAGLDHEYVGGEFPVDHPPRHLAR